MTSIPRTCSRCHAALPNEWTHAYCPSCKRAYRRAYVQSHKHTTSYRQSHDRARDAYRSKLSENARAWDAHKRRIYHSKYYPLQDGKCSICQDWYEKLCIDHNHETGTFISLLCHRCNPIVGNLLNGTIKVIEEYPLHVAYIKQHYPHTTL